MANLDKLKLPNGTTYNIQDNISGYTKNTGTVTSVTITATAPIAVNSTSAITTTGTRTLSHNDSGVTAGTYTSVTVDAKGHVTNGTNPTTLDGYGITDAVKTVKVGSTSYSPSSGTVSLPAYPTTLPASDTTSTYSATGTAPVNGKAVAQALGTLPEPMVFKGSLGTGGTITALPVDGTAKVGDTYKVITAGTYAGQAAKVGDTFICDSKTSSANTWTLIPSGDEPSGTVTSVATGTGLTGGPITTSGTISHADTSSQASVTNTGRTYIQSITLDGMGHVTALSSATETVTNTDEKVKQTNTTGSADYRVLLSYSANDTTTTEGARKSTKLKFNPSTGVLTATSFVGDISGGTGLTSGQVTGALGFTPYDSTNPAGYTSNTGTITSVKTTAGAHTTINVTSGAANFNVPTKTSHLTNDSGYVTSSGVTSVATSDGLTGGTITSTGTLKANLRSFTKLTNDSAAATEVAGRVYPVALDKTGYLSVVVPWENTQVVTSVAGKTGDVTVTSTDVGLGNVGNFKAVSTVANQGLTTTEKSNARTNIGAGTSSLTLGTTSSTAYRGDYGNTAYTHATDSSKLTTATASGLYKVASTAQGHIASLTAVTKADITGLGIPGSDTNTTYAFTSGTNGFTVTPSVGDAVTVTVTPSITNNVTGSGTSGYIAKWNGTNTVTNGPAFGSATTTYLRNDGSWATPPDTKNTAGSTDTSSKIFLVGATSQAANPQTYSDNEVYATSGVLTTKSVQVGGGAATMQYNTTTQSIDFVFA